MPHYTGIWPALVTPLTDEHQVNEAATAKLINDLIASGISGLYVCGGTGEGVILLPEVRRTMTEVALGVVAGRVPVIVHVGAVNTDQAVGLAQHASLIGADAISAVPPFYYSVPFSAVKAHYQAITDAASVPLYIYYIPGATGTPMAPEQLLELCAMDGVAGFKYTSQDLYSFTRLMAMRDPERVNVFSGPDELFLPCLALGADGAIGTTYNFMPRLYIDIYESYRVGEVEQARKLQWAATQLIHRLLPPGAIAATKVLLHWLGYEVGFCMPPLPRIEGDAAEDLRVQLEAAGLFELVQRKAKHGPAGDPMRGRLA
ncbi:MAG: dihydrodipicolinate synthase family protein [Chloroflexi bacterium]|nr:dihydrodipicolinate synthase family protein [Chloroflexota bacterium]